MTERRRAQRIIVRVIVCQTLATVVLVFAVFYSNYQGRIGLWESQVRGCERAKLDRAANARGWRTAQARSASQGQHGFSAIYEDIADSLGQRSRISCAEAFPKPTIL